MKHYPQPYNGWANRSTWNVNLWITNDEKLYRLVLRIAETSTNLGDFADRLEGFLLTIWNGRTPDKFSLAPVDYVDICDQFAESHDIPF